MKLVFHTAQDGIQKFEVEKNSVLIGRGSGCDIQIKVEGISRQHCRIDVDPHGEYLITDLGSTNGVLINNQRITANRPTPYMPFLPLAIGSIPHVTVEAGDQIMTPTKNPKQESTPVFKLELEDHSRKMNRLTRRGTPAAQRLRSDKSTAKKTQTPWLVIGLAIASIAGACYYLYLN